MGGGFGAKLGAALDGVLAARLSRQAKAPVRLMLTRFDKALAVGNRPSSFQKIKIGAKADGTLHAFEMENYGTAGIGAGGIGGGGGGMHSRALHLQGAEHPREPDHRGGQCRRRPAPFARRAIRPRPSAWNPRWTISP